MKHLILTIVFITFILSCNNKKKEPDYYIIKSISELKKKDSTIVAPAFFYGHHNFILTGNNKIFYHNNYVFHSCGTGIDFSKPPRLFIMPDSLTEIRDLSIFLKNNITEIHTSRLRETLVSISSDNDTIQNINFDQLMNFFKFKKEFQTNIRLWTEEEKYVSESKINNLKYDPRKIKWEIGFDQAIEPLEQIEFLPPVVDK